MHFAAKQPSRQTKRTYGYVVSLSDEISPSIRNNKLFGIGRCTENLCSSSPLSLSSLCFMKNLLDLGRLLTCHPHLISLLWSLWKPMLVNRLALSTYFKIKYCISWSLHDDLIMTWQVFVLNEVYTSEFMTVFLLVKYGVGMRVKLTTPFYFRPSVIPINYVRF